MITRQEKLHPIMCPCPALPSQERERKERKKKDTIMEPFKQSFKHSKKIYAKTERKKSGFS
jgi:hypothetical protein